MPSVVFDASSLVGALLKSESLPEQALVLARRYAVICMSSPVELEIRAVFSRPRFAALDSIGRVKLILDLVMGSADWHNPTVPVRECRDPKDDKYLELALSAGADIIVSSDDDLLALNPWRGISILRPPSLFARRRHGRQAGVTPSDTGFLVFDAANFEAEVLARRGLTVVDVWSPSCVPCRQLSRLLGALATELPDGVRIGTVNADENAALVARYDVRSVPTLLFFKNGAIVETRTGVDRRQVLKKAIETHA